MRAEAEPLSAILRVGDDDFTHGKPYRWSAVVRYLSSDEVELCGVVRRVNESVWIAIQNWADAEGLQAVHAVIDGERYVIRKGDAYEDFWK